MDREHRKAYAAWMKKGILAECVLLVALAAVFYMTGRPQAVSAGAAGEDYIKWVDFDVSYEALCQAYAWDVDTYESQIHLGWVELLAYTAARTGGSFDREALEILDRAAESVSSGEKTWEELTEDLKYYAYYREAYGAVLDGMVGCYEREKINEDGSSTYETMYGLKAYFPLARGFDYTHYDDFGVSRSYGYKRQHLGHDMMGQTGTPIRIICRIETSKNNGQIIPIQHAFLRDFLYRFILFPIT